MTDMQAEDRWQIVIDQARYEDVIATLREKDEQRARLADRFIKTLLVGKIWDADFLVDIRMLWPIFCERRRYYEATDLDFHFSLHPEVKSGTMTFDHWVLGSLRLMPPQPAYDVVELRGLAPGMSASLDDEPPGGAGISGC